MEQAGPSAVPEIGSPGPSAGMAKTVSAPQPPLCALICLPAARLGDARSGSRGPMLKVGKQTIDTDASRPQGRPVLARFRRSQAPKVIFNLGADYQRDLGDDLVGRVGARVRYRGAMYNQRQERFRADPLTTLDLSVGLKRPDGAWALDLVARNVTNSISQDFASPPTDPRLAPAYLAGPNPQRTVMMTASFSYCSKRAEVTSFAWRKVVVVAEVVAVDAEGRVVLALQVDVESRQALPAHHG